MLVAMNNSEIQTTRLDNGLTLIVERLPVVNSAAFSILVPAGCVYEPEGCNGTAALACDWIFRGAGSKSNRELSAALDTLGVQTHETVTPSHIVLHGACLAAQLGPALALYGDILRRPKLADAEFEPTLLGVTQTLQALEDEPRQKVMIELTRRCFPKPWHRPPEGTLDELTAVTPDRVREHWARCFAPAGTIVGVAGNVNYADVLQTVREVFGDWEASSELPEIVAQPAPPTVSHLPQESTQTQIGVAYRAVPYRDPDYYSAWAAVSVLSGGMSSRLFTEVREKRGLCYSVYATLLSLRDDGFVLCYAGTTNERAAETLRVLLSELRRLEGGIGGDELDRCKARAKSALVMSQESTSARAASLARDWYHLGRVVTLDEVRRKIEDLTSDGVQDYLRRHPAEEVTIVTIGPEPICA
jgi:predicted Zn-dependent peptidase